MKKISLKYKICLIIILILIIWFLFFLKPFMEFRKLEKEFLTAGKRYYEINNTQLPTGKRINNLYLKKLYDKDYVSNEFKEKIRSINCNTDKSFIRVKKKNTEYIYETYLECGIFKSMIDHEGPIIKLNGKEEITIYRNEKYKELGVEKVIDDSDGTIDIKNVKINNSNIKTSKTGTYEVIYKVKDSYNNITEKKRIIHVVETLNHIVSKQTNKKNVYKGIQYNNYIQLDGIIFRIVGINSDKSIKLVSNESLSALNYKDAEGWLNKYFYEKFSDSAKKYIKKDSIWCIDNVSDPNNYKKCKKYSKKNPVGLLSIIDYKNSKDNNGETYLSKTLLYNKYDTKNVYVNLSKNSIDANVLITPVLNIINNAAIVSGSGSRTNPYRLKNNTKHLKPSENINNGRVGEYVTYSGYKWRIINKEEDETTKVILDDIIRKDDNSIYYDYFSNSKNINFSVNDKYNIGYSLVNKVDKYLKTKIFVKKEVDYPKYSKNIGYTEEKKKNNYKIKLNLPSMYDLFSATLIDEYWYKEYTNDKYCYRTSSKDDMCTNYSIDNGKGIRVVAYINKKVSVISGKGNNSDPYIITQNK